VEAKAGDGESDGDTGSGDEGGKKTPNLSLMLKSRLQKLVDRADDECVSSHIFIDRHVLTPILQLSLRNSWNSLARNRSPVTTR